MTTGNLRILAALALLSGCFSAGCSEDTSGGPSVDTGSGSDADAGDVETEDPQGADSVSVPIRVCVKYSYGGIEDFGWVKSENLRFPDLHHTLTSL